MHDVAAEVDWYEPQWQSCRSVFRTLASPPWAIAGTHRRGPPGSQTWQICVTPAGSVR